MKNERRNFWPKQKETNAAWKIEMTKTNKNDFKNHLWDNPDSVPQVAQ